MTTPSSLQSSSVLLMVATIICAVLAAVIVLPATGDSVAPGVSADQTVSTGPGVSTEPDVDTAAAVDEGYLAEFLPQHPVRTATQNALRAHRFEPLHIPEHQQPRPVVRRSEVPRAEEQESAVRTIERTASVGDGNTEDGLPRVYVPVTVHPVTINLDSSALTAELVDMNRRIDQLIGGGPTPFAVPTGRRADEVNVESQPGPRTESTAHDTPAPAAAATAATEVADDGPFPAATPDPLPGPVQDTNTAASQSAPSLDVERRDNSERLAPEGTQETPNDASPGLARPVAGRYQFFPAGRDTRVAEATKDAAQPEPVDAVPFPVDKPKSAGPRSPTPKIQELRAPDPPAPSWADAPVHDNPLNDLSSRAKPEPRSELEPATDRPEASEADATPDSASGRRTPEPTRNRADASSRESTSDIPSVGAELTDPEPLFPESRPRAISPSLERLRILPDEPADGTPPSQAGVARVTDKPKHSSDSSNARLPAVTPRQETPGDFQLNSPLPVIDSGRPAEKRNAARLSSPDSNDRIGSRPLGPSTARPSRRPESSPSSPSNTRPQRPSQPASDSMIEIRPRQKLPADEGPYSLFDKGTDERPVPLDGKPDAAHHIDWVDSDFDTLLAENAEDATPAEPLFVGSQAADATGHWTDDIAFPAADSEWAKATSAPAADVQLVSHETRGSAVLTPTLSTGPSGRRVRVPVSADLYSLASSRQGSAKPTLLTVTQRSESSGPLDGRFRGAHVKPGAVGPARNSGGLLNNAGVRRQLTRLGERLRDPDFDMPRWIDRLPDSRPVQAVRRSATLHRAVSVMRTANRPRTIE